MNWRTWVFQNLQAVAVDQGFPATSVFAGGSLNGSPAERPFIIYRLQDTAPKLRGDGRTQQESRSLQVWAYDESGSYDTIDDILVAARVRLEGTAVPDGAIACEWTGEGPELFDDQMKAITRFATYRLIGAP